MTREHIDVMNLLSGKKQTISTSEIPISKIDPPTWQPRKKFEEEKLLQLQESIENHGLLQPIIVELVGERYQVVAGERRFRAVQNLGWQNVPVKIVENLDDKKRIQIQITENLNREDITPIERSKAILKLFEVSLGISDPAKVCNILVDYGKDKSRLPVEYANTVLAVTGSLSRSHMTLYRWIQLLRLPEELQEKLDDPNGVFTPKHAGEILKISDIKEQLDIARIIEAENLSAEQTKALIDSKSKTSSSSFTSIAKKLLHSIKQEKLKELSLENKKMLAAEISSLLEELNSYLCEISQ